MAEIDRKLAYPFEYIVANLREGGPFSDRDIAHALHFLDFSLDIALMNGVDSRLYMSLMLCGELGHQRLH